MSSIVALATLLLALASTSALKVYDDYEEYKEGQELSTGHEQSGQWHALGTDHVGEGKGQAQHQHHHFATSGEESEGSNKAGGQYNHKVTKGFQNYHHKDEVGKSTHYIDASGSHGDHYDRHGGGNNWGNHGHGRMHSDHYTSGYTGQKGINEQNFKEKKNSFSKKNDKKENYKGNIADVLYAKTPETYTTQFQSKAPETYTTQFQSKTPETYSAQFQSKGPFHHAPYHYSFY